MKMLCKILFGSHLYGTNTSDSDTDYKGIYLPEVDDILLQRVKKSINLSTGNNKNKNLADDIDEEYYSLNYFIELACKGEIVALDMLHATSECTLESSEIWEFLVANRNKFYTKNLKSFVGYCRKQAAKYGIKGSRLNAAKRVVEFLETTASGLTGWSEPTKMFQYWKSLPQGEHIHFHNDTSPRMYEVCGKKIQETATVGYTIGILKRFINQYGHRAELAAKNEGIDWKAISHALRAAIQVEMILEGGDIQFPLPDAKLLIAVKRGEMDYLTQVAPMLEGLMDRVEKFSKESTLPEQVNRKWWNEWLMNTLLDEIL